MVFRFFVIALILRLVLVGVAMAVVMWLLLEPGYHSATLLSAIVLALLVAELWRYVSRTNREVARFLDAVRFADYSQRFDFEKAGSGFASLGRTFTAIIEEMRERRTDQESDMRHLKALVEHIPVPLMTVHADDAITLQNNAARRLFGSTHVTRVNDLTQFGPGFARAVDEAIPGDRELVAFTVEGAEYRLTLAATEIIIGGNRERLISLQDIQSEIDATQAEAWQDLVRVLTHEIIRSRNGTGIANRRGTRRCPERGRDRGAAIRQPYAVHRRLPPDNSARATREETYCPCRSVRDGHEPRKSRVERSRRSTVLGGQAIGSLCLRRSRPAGTRAPEPAAQRLAGDERHGGAEH
jgi:PAS domain-containing protein